MNIYKKEIDAGLGNVIKDNAIAYSSSITVQEVTEEIANVAKAQLNNEQSIDLFCFNSILASTGWNGNDDVFDPKETFAAKDTPLFKKVNYMHQEKDVIGVIASAIAVKDGRVIEDVENDFDIITSSFIYKIWEDPKELARVQSIIEEIKNGEWYVSMECIFKHFDYAVIDENGSHSWIQRNEETSFLTKYLRIYGGPGVYNNRRIGRLLRNFTFSGQGLVKNPGNKRSVILNNFNAHAQAENIMENEQKVETLTVELSKAQAKIEKLQEDFASKVEAIAKAEQEKLAKQIEKLNLTVAEEKESKDKLKAEVEKAEAEKDELVKANKVLSEELDKLKADVAKAAAEKKLADRRSQLVTAGIADVEKVLSTWASATDEQFSSIVDLAKSAKVTETVAETNLATASLEPSIPSINTDIEKPETAKASAEYFTKLFTQKK